MELLPSSYARTVRGLFNRLDAYYCVEAGRTKRKHGVAHFGFIRFKYIR